MHRIDGDFFHFAFDEAVQRLQTQLDRDTGLSRFARLFRTSPTPMFVQSERTGAIVDVNRAFELVLGHARKDVLNRHDGFLWRHDRQHEAFVQDRRRHRRTAWHPITAVGRHGQTVAQEICSERDDGADDGLRITLLRVPGQATSALPTQSYAFVGALAESMLKDTPINVLVARDSGRVAGLLPLCRDGGAFARWRQPGAREVFEPADALYAHEAAARDLAQHFGGLDMLMQPLPDDADAQKQDIARRLDLLTPGDFAAALKNLKLTATCPTGDSLLKVLEVEVRMKRHGKETIGFI